MIAKLRELFIKSRHRCGHSDLFNASPRGEPLRLLMTRSASKGPRAIFRRDEARELRAQGVSWRQIARQLGVSPTTVRRVCAERNESQDLCYKPGDRVLLQV